MRRSASIAAATMALLALLTGSPASAAAQDSLRVTVHWGPGQTDTWTLTCDPTGGTHPNARRACAQLAGINHAFSAAPTGIACTSIWSGPERARVVGTWNGRTVDRRFSRTDGCQTARWDEYRALFTDPGAVTVHGSIDLGPTCPVQQLGQDCTTHGARATVTATGRQGSLSTSSGSSGFWLHVPRAVWSFTADAGMCCTPVRLDLRPRGPAPVVLIDCDTGIR